MKITHLSTNDRMGGAAIAAYRLHNGLVRSGIASTMQVRTKVGDDPTVLALREKPDGRMARFAYRRRRSALRRQRNRALADAPPTLDFFTDDRVAGRTPLYETMTGADVVNLHWVAGLVDITRFFASLPTAMPLVWTLHDMNPFTCGCHYSLGCDGFLRACRADMPPGGTNGRDLSVDILARKRAAYSTLARETTHIVAPSHWLADEARRSTLFGSFEVSVIPNALDTEFFFPRDKAAARELLGLPATGRIVLFVADAVDRYRKGFDLLCGALDRLQPEAGVIPVGIGAGRPASRPANYVSLGCFDNERMTALAYCAADVFVLPTRADNLPNVILEAMACGTPAVAFDVGGVPDMVRPGETGLLAPPEDVGALARALNTLLSDDELRARLAYNCREVAIKEYALDVQARRYVALYEELIEASARIRQ